MSSAAPSHSLALAEVVASTHTSEAAGLIAATNPMMKAEVGIDDAKSKAANSARFAFQEASNVAEKELDAKCSFGERGFRTTPAAGKRIMGANATRQTAGVPCSKF